MSRACADCLRRGWLLRALADHLTRAHERFGGDDSVLALPDAELIAALAGGRRREIARAYEEFEPESARPGAARLGLTALCRHASGYPPGLADLADPPAALYVAGHADRLAAAVAGPAAAVVGSRRATAYGLEVARTLGRGLAASGVAVVSGMALGVDSAAHEGALDGGGPTVAVLGGGADVPYPATKRRLHGRIVESACALSELPPGTRPRRWCFPARNRVIAALTQVVVVVEAAERSGALITARIARDLGRDVSAVPGPVTSPRARGSNDLLFDGAHVVRDAQDVLDLLFGVGSALAPPPAAPPLDARLQRVLDEVAAGRDTVGALARTPSDAAAVAVSLSELELLGRLRRGLGGRYVVAA